MNREIINSNRTNEITLLISCAFSNLKKPEASNLRPLQNQEHNDSSSETPALIKNRKKKKIQTQLSLYYKSIINTKYLSLTILREHQKRNKSSDLVPVTVLDLKPRTMNNLH